MGNLLTLAKRLEAKAKTVDTIASDKAVKTAMVLLEALAWRTPVDTTQAVSNWQVLLQAPAVTFLNPYVPGSFGHTQSASIQATLAAGRQALTVKKPGQIIYISNNAPYIKKLDNGSSRQAPAGIVAGAMLIARKSLRDTNGR